MRKNLIKSTQGAAALEFALIAPILIMLIFAIIEITGVMLVTAVMETAVRNASRAGITGYTPNGMTRDAYVQSMVKKNLVYLNPKPLVFTTKVYDSFANIGKPEPYVDANHNGVYNLGEPYTDINANNKWDADMGASGSGGPGAIVVYKVSYPWKVYTPFLSKFFTNHGKINITASMVVRNEPYNN